MNKDLLYRLERLDYSIHNNGYTDSVINDAIKEITRLEDLVVESSNKNEDLWKQLKTVGEVAEFNLEYIRNLEEQIEKLKDTQHHPNHCPECGTLHYEEECPVCYSKELQKYIDTLSSQFTEVCDEWNKLKLQLSGRTFCHDNEAVEKYVVELEERVKEIEKHLGTCDCCCTKQFFTCEKDGVCWKDMVEEGKKELTEYKESNQNMHKMIIQLRARFNAWDTPYDPTDQDIVDCIIRNAEATK